MTGYAYTALEDAPVACGVGDCAGWAAGVCGAAAKIMLDLFDEFNLGGAIIGGWSGAEHVAFMPPVIMAGRWMGGCTDAPPEDAPPEEFAKDASSSGAGSIVSAWRRRCWAAP